MILPLRLLKYLKNVFLKLRQIQLKVIHGTMTTVKKQLYNVNKLCLNSKDLQIPIILMTSKNLELRMSDYVKRLLIDYNSKGMSPVKITNILSSVTISTSQDAQ